MATTGTATGAERGGGAARVDGDGSVPAVGDRKGEVDEVGEDAAKPKEAVPKREMVRGNDGGEPELGDGIFSSPDLSLVELLTDPD
uniref:Pr1-like protein n=1 Tax=Oryza sativa subsp. japonica TaxID=39947 RepID=Q6EPB2_ORYSJ|nr:pr1-like protein [Oryza sativa Japonica Group]